MITITLTEQQAKWLKDVLEGELDIVQDIGESGYLPKDPIHGGLPLEDVKDIIQKLG